MDGVSFKSERPIFSCLPGVNPFEKSKSIFAQFIMPFGLHDMQKVMVIAFRGSSPHNGEIASFRSFLGYVHSPKAVANCHA
jgi:hypothetical protein